MTVLVVGVSGLISTYHPYNPLFDGKRCTLRAKYGLKKPLYLTISAACFGPTPLLPLEEEYLGADAGGA